MSLPLAVIELSFDPVLQVGDVRLRLETLAVAVVIFVALVVAAIVANATPVDPSRPPDAPGDEPGELNRLRADDLLYIAVAALPGAIIGGRIGYWLDHRAFFDANPGAILNPSMGGLQLSLGVVGGVLTAAIVARLLGAPIGRWMHAMVLPLLLALAAGKAAMALGGSGQGTLSDAGWATAYLGPGPWGSLAPGLPANPSQVYEALATAAVLVVTMYVMAFDLFRGRNGGAFLLAIALWAAARGLVAFTWRDPTVLGPFNMDQLISIGIAAGAIVLMLLVGGASTVRSRRHGPTTGEGGGGGGEATDTTAPRRVRQPGEPEWPDPEQRPQF